MSSALHKIINKNSERGFTLLELLISMAIIGLLAAIVMSQVSESRERSRNEAKNSLVIEYQKALELVRTETGAYPTTAGVWDCIGDYGYGSGGVGAGCLNWDTNPVLNTALEQFIALSTGQSELPVNRKGFIYQENASAYRIQWFLEGVNRECVSGRQPLDGNYNNESITQCEYQHL